MSARTPLVSCVLATHNGAATLGTALASLFRQTLRDIEVVVVDDGSTDETSSLLDGVDDPRLVIVRHETSQGLATSLNAGLDRARGRYVARLDADDVALPARLERQLEALTAVPGLALSGTAALELDERGRPGRLHVLPVGDAAVRWHLHFSCPFFHPSVVVDRDELDRHDLRYDTSFLESEDYDLWSRLLRVSGGDNLREPLLLKRVHAGQATQRNREVQRTFQRIVAVREIAATAPGLGDDRGGLAWSLGAGEPIPDGRHGDATEAFLELLASFPQRRSVRGRAARQLARAALAAPLHERGAIVRPALRLDPALPLSALTDRRRRRRAAATARTEARRSLRRLAAPAGRVRVAVISPEPTPYRSPLFDRVAERPELALTVIYAARTVAGRGWDVEPRHPSVHLRGVRLPGARRLLRHDYPLTPGVFAALAAADPDVVVVSGWSTFASQAALAWARARNVPYLLLVSSHERGERTGWRKIVRRLVVPRIVRASAGALVLGTLSRASLVANGMPPERVRVFANTIDVASWGVEADNLRTWRKELRTRLGATPTDVVVLSVARLAPEKGLDVLIRAVAELREPHVLVVVAGSGPQRGALEQLARENGVRLTFTGELEQRELPGLYAAADVFALLSSWEPWGVVVNEAAACGLPLVLSDQVGAAPDLLHDGENGVLVPSGNVGAAADALRRLAGDAGFRAAAGARSRELVGAWGYEPSVEAFVQAVCEAAAR